MRVRYSFSSRKTGTIEGGNRHKQAIPKLIREVIRISDIILEVLDARFIKETRNQELERFIKEQNKKLVYVLNKSDLMDITQLKQSLDLGDLKEPYVLFSCKSLMGRKRLRDKIKIEVKKLKMGERRAQIGIIGYPNTGKSSLINLLAGRNSANTSSQPGFTKGIQKIRLAKGILLLDTPGVIPEEEDLKSEKNIKKHAKIGVETYNKVKEPDLIIYELMKQNPDLFESYYLIDARGDSEVLIEELGKKKNFILKGNKIDKDRTARLILKDWQEGKIK